MARYRIKRQPSVKNKRGEVVNKLGGWSDSGRMHSTAVRLAISAYQED